MRRQLVTIGLVLMMMVALAGPALADWTGTITLWDAPRWRDADGDPFHWIKAKIAEFEALNPGVTIDMVETPWAEMGERLSIAIAGRSWPDVAPVDISGAVNAAHIEQGVVESMDPFFSEEELADFFEGALESYTFDGSLYGVPMSMAVHVMLLNLDIFEARGVEPPVDGRWTWDEFVETAKALTFDSTGDGNIDTFGFSTYILNGYYEAWPFFYMDGGAPIVDGQFGFNSPEAVGAMQKLADLKFVHEAAPVEMGSSDVGGTFQAFAHPDQRYIAMQPWNSWAIATVSDEGGNFYMPNAMVAEYPIGESGEPVTIGGAGGWVVFHQRDDAKLAKVAEFVKFLSTTEEQYVFSRNYGTFPARFSTQDLNPFDDQPLMARAAEILQYAVSVPEHPNWSQIDERIQTELQLVFAGEKSAQDAMDAAAAAAQRLF